MNYKDITFPVTDAEENDETLTNIGNFINKSANNQDTNNEASKAMTPQNKNNTINKTATNPAMNKTGERVERSNVAEERSIVSANRTGVARDNVAEIHDDVMEDDGQSSSSDIPATNGSRPQENKYLLLVLQLMCKCSLKIIIYIRICR